MEARAQRQPRKDIADAGIRVYFVPRHWARTSDGRYAEPFMWYQKRLPWGGWDDISRQQALAVLAQVIENGA